MEDEIDLRPYIELLIKRWYWIVGAAILAGLIAFGVTSLQDDVYEATALVAVTQERLITQFDPRFETTEEETQPVDALPEFATSDELLQTLLIELETTTRNIESIEDLRHVLEANPGNDPSLIRLSTTHTNPAEAARISNLWAEIFVAAANDIFGDGNGDELIFFEEQLAESEEELDAFEADLVEFKGVDRRTLLGNQIASLDKLQDNFLAEKRELALLDLSIQDLNVLITETSSGSALSFADQLTSLVLQLRVFNANLNLPIELQLDSSNEITSNSRDDQLAILLELQETIISRYSAIEQELIELEPTLLALQEELQEAAVEFNRLVLNRDVAKETYLSLARKVDEERITSEDMTRGIRLASHAAVPVQEAQSSSIVSIMTAAFLGILLIVLIIILRAWWSGVDQKSVTNVSSNDSNL